MKCRLRIEFIFDFYGVWKFLDQNGTKALTTLRPKVTFEKLTDGYPKGTSKKKTPCGECKTYLPKGTCPYCGYENK